MTATYRLIRALLLLASVIALGTTGYTLVEGWTAFDALYMTVITIGSVGFAEVHPLTTAGRGFTIALILVGLGTMAYGLGAVTAFWVEGDVLNLWEKRRMARRIADLREHVIICGGGKTGQLVAMEMLKTRTPLVCIEIDPTREPSLRALGPDALCIVGDATDERVLREAQVEEARGLVACLTADRDNLFVVLTAREMNPRLRIVSRLATEDARRKLLKAGADAVVSGRQIGALRLASEMLRPNVVSVLDAMLRAATDVRVEEIPVGAAVAGQPLAALQLEQRAGVTVFAMRETGTGQHVFNPASTRILREGDVLIACADADQLGLARRVATGQA